MLTKFKDFSDRLNEIANENSMRKIVLGEITYQPNDEFEEPDAVDLLHWVAENLIDDEDKEIRGDLRNAVLRLKPISTFMQHEDGDLRVYEVTAEGHDNIVEFIINYCDSHEGFTYFTAGEPTNETVIVKPTKHKPDITKTGKSLASAVEPLIQRMANMDFPSLQTAFTEVLRDTAVSASDEVRNKWSEVVRNSKSKFSLMQAITNLYLKAANLGVSESVDPKDTTIKVGDKVMVKDHDVKFTGKVVTSDYKHAGVIAVKSDKDGSVNHWDPSVLSKEQHADLDSLRAAKQELLDMKQDGKKMVQLNGFEERIDYVLSLDNVKKDSSGNFVTESNESVNMEQLKAAAKKIKHCGDYGKLFVNGSRVYWMCADSDGQDEYTPLEDIKTMLKEVDGVSEVDMESEAGPGEDGWSEVKYKESAE